VSDSESDRPTGSTLCQGCAVNERRGEDWDPFHYGTCRPCDICGKNEGLRALMPNATAVAPKPPLGIMPKRERIWMERRLAEIAYAVNRYDEVGLTKPACWANESSRLKWALKYNQLCQPAVARQSPQAGGSEG